MTCSPKTLFENEFHFKIASLDLVDFTGGDNYIQIKELHSLSRTKIDVLDILTHYTF